MAGLEVVVGNAGTQMVDVMNTDVAGEPLEDLWQFVEGAALEGGGGVVPVFTALPIDVLELVLDIK